jgi:hypothetical protein
MSKISMVLEMLQYQLRFQFPETGLRGRQGEFHTHKFEILGFALSPRCMVEL